MSEHGLPFATPTMTPLEQLIDEHRSAFLMQQWYAHADFEKRARAEIAANVESVNRSIGQLFRHAAARLAANFQGASK